MTIKWKVTLIFPTPFLRICYLSCAKRDDLPELTHCPWVCAALEDVKTESTTTEARTKANAFIHLMERSTFIVAISSNTVRIISTLLHDDEITKFKAWALQWWYSARVYHSLIRALTPDFNPDITLAPSYPRLLKFRKSNFYIINWNRFRFIYRLRKLLAPSCYII
jgi:hypothetical protein